MTNDSKVLVYVYNSEWVKLDCYDILSPPLYTREILLTTNSLTNLFSSFLHITVPNKYFQIIILYNIVIIVDRLIVDIIDLEWPTIERCNLLKQRLTRHSLK